MTNMAQLKKAKSRAAAHGAALVAVLACPISSAALAAGKKFWKVCEGEKAPSAQTGASTILGAAAQHSKL